MGAGAGASIASVSLFTGIGGFDLGFERAGIRTLIQCEIDANCRELLERKFPDVVRLPDVRAIAAVHRRMRKGKPGPNYEFWKRIFELLRLAVVLDGGFPCQDLSVAGARAGLAGERSGLWFAVRRLAGLFRWPWIVLENVPGLLSSQEGRDFDTLLRGLEELGYRWAYRVLDAQYLGVAQRRERVFIVASLGAAGRRGSADGEAPMGEHRGVRGLPDEVLFEPESVCGDSPPSREAREGVAGTLTRRALDGSSPCGGDGRDGLLVAGPLGSGSPGKGWSDDLDRSGAFIPDTVGTLTDGSHRGGGHNGQDAYTGRIVPAVAWALQARDEKGADSNTKPGHLVPVLADPITANEGATYTNEGSGNFRLRNVVPVTPFDTTQITHPENRSKPEPGDPSPTLANGGHPPAIAFTSKDHGADASADISPTLRSMTHRESHMNGGGQVAVAFKPSHFTRGKDGAPSDRVPLLTADADKGDQDPVVQQFSGVRRLTPRECERLQGFPDDWTAGFADSVRYRMLGNAVNVACSEWLGRRLVAVIRGERAA